MNPLNDLIAQSDALLAQSANSLPASLSAAIPEIDVPAIAADLTAFAKEAATTAIGYVAPMLPSEAKDMLERGMESFSPADRPQMERELDDAPHAKYVAEYAERWEKVIKQPDSNPILATIMKAVRALNPDQKKRPEHIVGFRQYALATITSEKGSLDPASPAGAKPRYLLQFFEPAWKEACSYDTIVADAVNQAFGSRVITEDSAKRLASQFQGQPSDQVYPVVHRLYDLYRRALGEWGYDKKKSKWMVLTGTRSEVINQFLTQHGHLLQHPVYGWHCILAVYNHSPYIFLKAATKDGKPLTNGHPENSRKQANFVRGYMKNATLLRFCSVTGKEDVKPSVAPSNPVPRSELPPVAVAATAMAISANQTSLAGAPGISDKRSSGNPVRDSRIKAVHDMWPGVINFPNGIALGSPYGPRSDPKSGVISFHGGQDFTGPLNAPIYAGIAGTIRKAEFQNGYGNMVQIETERGDLINLGHLARILVQPGARVTASTKVGLMGTTGKSTGVHLHADWTPPKTARTGLPRLFPDYTKSAVNYPIHWLLNPSKFFTAS